MSKLFATMLVRSSLVALSCLSALPALADDPARKPDAAPELPPYVPPKDVSSEGSVTVAGKAIAYQAVAGTLQVSEKDKEDLEPKDVREAPQASMAYVAYFRRGTEASKRPLMFLYNGGPGSASLWLHMGGFGPVRVQTGNDKHTAPAPYQLVNNEYSLLDVADLVFIDAPGTGFSRVQGKDKEKAFYGVDADARAFARFIDQFLVKYGRWNSPKYLFGESYGTTRSAVLAQLLQGEHNIDVNGVILLSQVLDFDLSADMPQMNPGHELAYALALPTYAATAWYHKTLPQQAAELEPFLAEVNRFAEGDYLRALIAGPDLPAAERHAMAERLHGYTGLPVEYIEKANLRINGGGFSQHVQEARGLTTGRFDTRFAGTSVDRLDKEAFYDPADTAIGPAYVAAYNEYARKTLKFGEGQPFKPVIDLWRSWDYRHRTPFLDFAGPTNVMPDLALAMKRNPHLKVLNLAGYYDLATPYAAARYELRHLPIPAELRGNIQSIAYPAGHMIYVHLPSLKKLHEDVAGFVEKTHD